MNLDPAWVPAVIGLCGALIVAILTVGSNAILALNTRRFTATHAWEEKQLEARRLAYSSVLMHLWHMAKYFRDMDDEAWHEPAESYRQREAEMNNAIAANVLLLSNPFRERARELRRLLIINDMRFVDVLEPTPDEKHRAWLSYMKDLHSAQVDLEAIARQDLVPPHLRDRHRS